MHNKTLGHIWIETWKVKATIDLPFRGYAQEFNSVLNADVSSNFCKRNLTCGSKLVLSKNWALLGLPIVNYADRLQKSQEKRRSIHPT